MTLLAALMFAWLIWQFADTLPRQQWLMRAFILGTAVALAALFLGPPPRRIRSADCRTSASRRAAESQRHGHLACDRHEFRRFIWLTRPGKKGVSFVKLAYWVLHRRRQGAASSRPARGPAFSPWASRDSLALVTLFRVAMEAGRDLHPLPGRSGFLVPRVVPEYHLARVQEGTAAGTFQDRLARWQEAAGQVDARGRSWVSGRTPTRPPNNVSHNTFLSVLVENGLVGLAIYVSFWALLLLAILFAAKSGEDPLDHGVHLAMRPHMPLRQCRASKGVVVHVSAWCLRKRLRRRAEAVPSAPAATAANIAPDREASAFS